MPCKYNEEIEHVLNRRLSNIRNVIDRCDCDGSTEECFPAYKGMGNHPAFPDDKPVEGERFDHKWYLTNNPDVKADECFGTRPYVHYISSGKAEGRKPFESAKPKINKFVPEGSPVLLWQGHDGSPSTVGKDGAVYVTTGDGFVNGVKYPTCIFKLPTGKDPMKPSNWLFLKGSHGKAAPVCKNGLYLLQSDKGGGWEPAFRTRIWNYNTGHRSEPLQIHDSKSLCYFAVQKGPNQSDSYQKDTVDIGYVRRYGDDTDAKTPIIIMRGRLDDVNSFKSLGAAKGLNGPRDNCATGVTITYIPDRKQYVAVLGDWSRSIIYQFITNEDNVLGPYHLVREDKFKPPMERHKYTYEGDSNKSSGVFMSNFVEIGGRYYRLISGHAGTGNAAGAKDDAVWIQKVKAV